MKNSSKIAIASPRGRHSSGYPNSLSEVIGELLKKIGKAFVGLADFFCFSTWRLIGRSTLRPYMMGLWEMWGRGVLFGDSENVGLDDSERIDEITTAEACDVFGGNFLSVGFEVGF